MKFGIALAIIVHYTVQFNLECCKSCVSNMGPNILKNISQDVLKVKLKNFKHTIRMKFGRTLAIIVHYTVQFNVECCKRSVSNMGPNTSLKNYHKTS